MKKNIIAMIVLCSAVVLLLWRENSQLEAYAEELESVQDRVEAIESEQPESKEVVLNVTVDNEEIVARYERLLKKISELDIIVNDRKDWYLTYKEIVSEYPDLMGQPITIYDCYTAEEILFLQRTIETETYQADFDSKVNVASVLLNRIRSDVFPDDAIEVVTQPNQFAYWRTKVSEDTVLALEYAFEIGDTVFGATSFRSDAYPRTWNHSKLVYIDEAGHGFYVRVE